MLSKNAIGNLINRYKAVLKKCNLINIFGSLAVAGMMVAGTAVNVKADDISDYDQLQNFIKGSDSTKIVGNVTKNITATNNNAVGSMQQNLTLNLNEYKLDGQYDNNTKVIGITVASGKTLNIAGDNNSAMQNFTQALYNSGTLNSSGLTFSGNTATDNGGAIYNYGKLDFAQGKTNTFTNNETTSNVLNTGGGAIFNYFNRTITFNSSQESSSNNIFSKNSAGYEGGAVRNLGSIIFNPYSNNTFSENSAGNNGGAIRNWGTFTFGNYSTNLFEENEAVNFGGVFCNVDSGSISFGENSQNTFRGNKVTQGYGGVMYTQPGTQITFGKNSTNLFEGNKAKYNGGAIYNTGTFNFYGGTTTFGSSSDNAKKNYLQAGDKTTYNDIYNTGTINIGKDKDNTATVTINSGYIGATTSNQSDIVIINSGSTLNINAASSSTGTWNNAGNLNINEATSLSAFLQTAGTTTIATDKTLTFTGASSITGGTVSNSGTVEVKNGAALILTGSYSGTGTVTVCKGDNVTAALNLSGGSSGAGNENNFTITKLTGGGDLTVNTYAKLILSDNEDNFSGNITNNGKISLSSSSNKSNNFSGTFTNYGTFQVTGGSTSLTGTFTQAEGGATTISVGSSLTASLANVLGDFTNSGTFKLNGELSRNIVGSGTTVLMNDITLAEDHTVIGTLNMNGQIIDMRQTQTPYKYNTLTVGALSGNGTLKINVDATNNNDQATDTDSIVITGTGNNGTLNISDMVITQTGEMENKTYPNYVTYVSTSGKGSLTGLTLTVGTNGTLEVTDGTYTYTFTANANNTGALDLLVSGATVNLPEYIQGLSQDACDLASFSVSSNTTLATLGETYRPDGSKYGKELTVNITNGSSISGSSTETASTSSGITVASEYTLNLDGSSAEGASMTKYATALVNNGTLNVRSVNFSNNSTTNNGGAINNEGTIDFSGAVSFTSNNAEEGGAINNEGTITFSDTATFTGNTAEDTSGAILNSGTIDFSGAATFTSNTATDLAGTGGAIYNSGTITFSDTATFTGNNVEDSGGAIYNSGTIDFSDTATFTGNNAEDSGGAIVNEGNITFAKKATFTGNYLSGIEVATGGAIGNASIIIFKSTAEFKNNYGTGTDYALAGAIFNIGTIDFNGDTTFDGNYAYATESYGVVYGGAISNVIEEDSIIPEATINFYGTTTLGSTEKNYVQVADTKTYNDIYNAGIINIGDGKDKNATVTLYSGYMDIAPANETDGATLAVKTGSTLNFYDTGSTILGTLTNSGSVNVGDGNNATTLTISGTYTDIAATETAAGSRLAVNTGSTLIFNGGDTSILGALTDNGSLILGQSESTTETAYSIASLSGTGYVTINEKATVTTKVEGLTGTTSTVTNNGTLKLVGNLSHSIAGSGTTVLMNDITLAEDRTVVGTLNLNEKTIDMIQTSSPIKYNTLTVGALSGNGNLKIKVDATIKDNKATAADSLVITNTGSNGTLNLSDMVIAQSGQPEKKTYTNYVTYVTTSGDGEYGNLNLTVGGNTGKLIVSDGAYTYTFTASKDTKGALDMTISGGTVNLPEYIAGSSPDALNLASYTVKSDLSEYATLGTTANGDQRPNPYTLTINIVNGSKIIGDNTKSGITVDQNYTLNLDSSSATGTAMNSFASALVNNGIVNITSVDFSNNNAGTGNGGGINNAGTLNLHGNNTFTDNAAAIGNDIYNAGTINVVGGSTTLNSGFVQGEGGSTTVDDGAKLILAGTNSTASGSALNNNGTLNVSGSNSFDGGLNNAGDFELTGGETTISGLNQTAGSTTIAENASLALSGTNSTTSGSSMTNNGTLNLSGTNNFAGALNNGGSTIIAEGGTLDLSGASSTTENSFFSNAGTLKITGQGSTFTADGVFTNTGNFTVGEGATATLSANGILAANSTLINNGTLNFKGMSTAGNITNTGTLSLLVDCTVTLPEGSMTAYKDDVNGKLNFAGGYMIADFGNFLKSDLSKNINGKLTDTKEGGTLVLRSSGVFKDNTYYSSDVVNAKTALFGNNNTNALLTFQGAVLGLAEDEDVIAQGSTDTSGSSTIIKNIVIATIDTQAQEATKVTEIYNTTRVVPIKEGKTTTTVSTPDINMASSNFVASALQIDVAKDTPTKLSAVDCAVTFTGSSLMVNKDGEALKTDLTIGGTDTTVAAGGSSTVNIAGNANMTVNSITASGTKQSSLLTVTNGAALTSGSITTAANAKALEIQVAGELTVQNNLEASTLATTGTVKAKNLTAETVTAAGNANINVAGTIATEVLTAVNSSVTADIVAVSGENMSVVSGSSFTATTVELGENTKISVGSDIAEKGGDTLIVTNLKLTGNNYLLVDPDWNQESNIVAVENIGIASGDAYVMMEGRAGVAQNSMLTLGTTDQTWLTTCLRDATDGGLKVDGMTAAFGLYKALNISTGTLIVDGSLNESNLEIKVQAAQNGSVYFADNSFVAVNGNIAGTTANNAALKAITVNVGNNAKLYLSNVQTSRKYYIVNASDALTIADNSWDGNNLKIDNALLNASLSKDANSAWIEVTSSDISTILPKLDPALAHAANTLIAMDGNGGLDSDNYAARFINRASTNIADKDKAAATIEGSAKLAFAGAVPQMNLDLAQRMNNALTSRDFLSSAPGIGAGAGNSDNGFALWALPTYQYSNGDGFKSGNFKSGYEANVGGMALGGDYTLNNSLRLGLAINGGGGKVETDGGDYNETKNDINYIGVNAYAGWKINNFSLFGQIGFLRTNNDLSQKTPSEMNMADSKADDVHSNVFTLGMRASYQFNTKWIDIMPYLGLDYYNVHTSAFTVKSDGHDMFHAGTIEQNYLQMPIGVNMKKVLTDANGWNVKAALDLSVIPNIGSHKATQDIRLQGLTNNANIGHVITDECTGRAIVGIEAKRGNLGLGLNYSFQGGNHITNHGVQGMVNWKF